MKNLTFVILFSVSCVWLFGQNKAFVSFSPDSIKIGEKVTLFINLVLEEGLSLDQFDLTQIALEKIPEQKSLTAGDKLIGDFEILNSKSWQDVNSNGIVEKNELLWTPNVTGKGTAYQNEFLLQSWDFGTFTLPRMKFPLTNGETITSDESSLIVLANMLDPSQLDSVGMAPLKPIIPENYLLGDYLKNILPIALPVLALLVFWYFIQRTKLQRAKKKQALDEPEVVIPAHEIALERLKGLEQKELWQKGEIKVYQSEITHIIREYLENRYQILALESTTSEISHQMQSLGFDNTMKLKLQNILQMADLVKFAKAKPPADIHAQFMKEAYAFVENTKQIKALSPEIEKTSEEEE